MFTDSKPKFRSRKLDFQKNLEIFRYDDAIIVEERLSNLHQNSDESSRGVAPVSTGVDKEEEDELHLKQALQGHNTNIPVPKSSSSTLKRVLDYDLLYKDVITIDDFISPTSQQSLQYKQAEHTPSIQPLFILSKKLNPPHSVTQNLQSIFAYANTEYKALPGKTEFNCSLKDISFLELNSIPPSTYEDIVQTIEFIHELTCFSKFSQELSLYSHDPSLIPESLCSLFSISKEQISCSIAFFLEERKFIKNSSLKYEDIPISKGLGEAPVLKIGADPYVCFRRRELKLQSRKKTRRSETQITDRLKALWIDISFIKEEFSTLLCRDKFKRASLLLEGDLFLQYKKVDDLLPLKPSQGLPTFRGAAQSLMESHRLLKDIKLFNSSKNVVESSTNHPKKARNISSIGGRSLVPLASPPGYKAFYPPLLSKVIEDDFWEAKKYFNCDDLTYIMNEEDSSSSPSSSTDFLSLSLGPNEDISSLILSLHSNLLNTKDFTQLQTPLGNYNVHAVQSANQIMKPMSHQAWIAATQAIFSNVQQLSSKKKSSSSSKGSPRRKKISGGSGGGGGDDHDDGDDDKLTIQQNLKKQTPSMGRESPSTNILNGGRSSSIQLGSNNQITVQVKAANSSSYNDQMVPGSTNTPPPSLLPPSSGGGGGGINSNSSGSNQLSRNSARFTLHGLSQSSQADEND